MTTSDLPDAGSLRRFKIGLFTATLLLLLFNASRWLTRVPGTAFDDLLSSTLQDIGVVFMASGLLARQSKRRRVFWVLSIVFMLSALLVLIAVTIPSRRARM